jgi:putative heme-binding domain-containing protein
LLAFLVQFSQPGTDLVLQSAALEARARLENQPVLTWLAVAVLNPELPDPLRESLTKLVEAPDTEAVSRWLAEAMRSSPAAVQRRIAAALASSRQGGELLLAWMDRGIASTRLLADRQLLERLQQTLGPERLEQLTGLVNRLPDLQGQIEQLIEQRRQAVLRGAGDVGRGAAVFRRVCAACHQINGQGAVVGPQLDGVGQRGLARLLEDLLDPHRNVDVAFRTVTLQLADGRVLVALPRGERGALRVFVDQEGKEFTAGPDEIEQERSSALSLMPENVAAGLPESDFVDLVAFLLQQRARNMESAPHVPAQ